MDAMPPVANLPIFVYGTLQRGEERAHHWPRAPLSVEEAEVQGRLYDLGPYPALLEGGDRIAGELWHLAASDIEITCRVLDEVEGYAQGEPDWYCRDVVLCKTGAGENCQAYTYRYAREATITESMRIHPGLDGLCRWQKRFS